jgi:cellulose synthase/poly-beta-1,6-N-acetylglucosamine synthase-like glycosyltransferase
MLFLQIVFWVSVLLVFYSYLGYGMFLWLYLKITGRRAAAVPPVDVVFEPEVTLVVATYNEELIIRKKIENTLALDYPADKLRIIIIADGSSDDTANIISRYPRVQLLYQPGREGKVAAINRAMPFVTTPYTIFCDANTMLNKESIRELVKHYTDPSIGAVAGEKKVIDLSEEQNAAGAGEGLYWKYESLLKRLDAQFYTVVGAAGELFSIRTALFEPVGNDILLDDFIMSMKICKKGYRVMYEPKAYAAEAPSMTMREERKRKVRISAGGFQSVLLLKDLLNIFKYGRLSFQYISHRVLRWIVCPVLLPVILLSNIYLAAATGSRLYDTLLVLQALFYAAALLGWLFALKHVKSKIFYVPYYFVFMNISLYTGFSRFIHNTQTVLWDKADRKV